VGSARPGGAGKGGWPTGSPTRPPGWTLFGPSTPRGASPQSRQPTAGCVDRGLVGLLGLHYAAAVPQTASFDHGTAVSAVAGLSSALRAAGRVLFRVPRDGAWERAECLSPPVAGRGGTKPPEAPGRGESSLSSSTHGTSRAGGLGPLASSWQTREAVGCLPDRLRFQGNLLHRPCGACRLSVAGTADTVGQGEGHLPFRPGRTVYTRPHAECGRARYEATINGDQAGRLPVP